MSAAETQYRCEDPTRRIAVRAHPTLNGIDHLEVLDEDAPPDSPRQRTLLVHCLKPLPALTASNVDIEGGVRVTGVGVTWAFPAPSVPAANATPAELELLSELLDADRVLVVRTDSSGDFSTYRLSIVGSPSAPGLTADFDPELSSVTFSFKVDCPSEFDCRPRHECPEPVLEAPHIDYVAKDYASFRRLMLDRLSLLVPAWQERNPADLGVGLVELLAYAGDHLSYFQDAVATEAYLGTARQRISVRRHARLLDYPMHDGANARAWVHIRVDTDGIPLGSGSQLLTTIDAPRWALDPGRLAPAVTEGALVFETLHDIMLWQAHNEIRFHTWGDERCCLPAGATRATLDEHAGGVGMGLAVLAPEQMAVEQQVHDQVDPRHQVQGQDHEVEQDSLEAEAQADAEGALVAGAGFVHQSWRQARLLGEARRALETGDSEHAETLALRVLEGVGVARVYGHSGSPFWRLGLTVEPMSRGCHPRDGV